MIKYLKDMFENFSQDLASFSYILTKIKPVQKDSILESIQTCFESSEDPSCKLFVQDLLNKKDKIAVLDPLSNNNKEIQKILFDNQFIKPCLKLTFSNSSKRAIEKQFELNFNFVIESFQRDEFDLAVFKLDEMIFLAEISKFKDLFFEITKLRSKLFENNFDRDIQYFNNTIQSNRVLGQNQLENYQKLLEKAERSEIFFKKFQDFSINSIVTQNLNDQFTFVQINMQTECLESLKISMDNFKMLKQNFSNKKDILFSNQEYENACKLLLDNLIKSYLIIEKNPSFEVLIKEIQSVRQIVLNFSDHLKEQNEFDFDFSRLKVILKSNLELNSNKIVYRVNNEDYLEIDLDLLVSTDLFFQNALNNTDILELIPLETIQVYQKKFLAKNVREYLLELKSEIEQELSSFCCAEDSIVKIYFNQFHQIKQKENFDEFSSKIYTEVFKLIKSFISNLCNKLMDKLKEYFNSETRVNSLFDFKSDMKYFKLFIWFDELNKAKLFERSYLKLQTFLLEEFDYDFEQIEALKFGLENFLMLQNAEKLLEKLDKKFSKLIQEFPILEDKLDRVNRIFKDKINADLTRISMEMERFMKNPELLDYSLIEAILNFLNSLQNKNKYAIKYEQEIKSFLLKRINTLIKQIEQNLILIDESAMLNDQSKLKKESFCLKNSIRELYLLETNYKDLFERYSKVDWRTDFLEKASDIINQNENSIIYEEYKIVYKNNLICKELSQIDRYLKSNISVEKSFTDLFIIYCGKMADIKKALWEKCENCIKSHDYFMLITNLKKIEDIKADYSFLIGLLIESLSNLLNKALRRSKYKFDKELVEQVNESLDIFKSAKEKLAIFFKISNLNSSKKNEGFISKILDFIPLKLDLNLPEIQNEKTESSKIYLEKITELDRVQEEIISNLREHVKELILAIEDRIKYLDFELADKQIELLLQIEDRMDYLDETSLEKIKIFKIKPNSLHLKRLSQLSIKDYSSYPPREIYSRLKLEMRKEFVIMVSKSFEEPIKFSKKSSDLDELEKYIRYLNDEMQEFVKLSIKNKRNKF